MTDERAFDAADVISQLTDFQRNTVEHVVDRLYGSNPTDRFLIADETGLGKTMVARGVIAKAIEKLQHEESVDRIDVVYVCSNQDLAHQNLRKLNVTDEDHHGIASRLTLLAKHSRAFSPIDGDSLKSVNLVSFTPGTSFTTGWRSGKAEERALLFLLLRDRLQLTPEQQDGARRILRGGIRTEGRFEEHIGWLEADLGRDLDPGLAAAFVEAIAEEKWTKDSQQSLADEFQRQIAENSPDADRVWALVGRLRATLARISIKLLTPDLIILDEFQRFRDLLDVRTDGGELANHLFGYRHGNGQRAKVLLLSATPFKAFTFSEEASDGEDHHRDFQQLLGFLGDGGDPASVERIGDSLRRYRHGVISGRVASTDIDDARSDLLQLMVRTERPRWIATKMSSEHVNQLDAPDADNLRNFVAMKRLAAAVDAPFRVDYWKSAPYFLNFMDGYKIGDRVRAALESPHCSGDIAQLLSKAQALDAEAMDQLRPVPMGNERMEQLAEATVRQGWWRLLWVPPSLPYLEPGGPYAEEEARNMSKVLVFSSWSATPASVAVLLSHEARQLAAGEHGRSLTADQRSALRGRLNYRMESDGGNDRPSSMSTLALFWPMPGLALTADPRQAGAVEARDSTADAFHTTVAERLARDHQSELFASGAAASHWFEALRRVDSHPEGLSERHIQEAFALAESEDDLSDAQKERQEASIRRSVRSRHVALAHQLRGRAQDREAGPEVLASIADLAAHSPANIAYRALSRVRGEAPEATASGLWIAAVRLAASLRTLFSRPETSMLLDQHMPDDEPYWRKILRYCAWGNLQASLDEYVHHLHVGLGAPTVSDSTLLELADMASVALQIRDAQVTIFDPRAGSDGGYRNRVSTRFAVRFGSRNEKEESVRLPVVRQAFNSPFHPFVLATTSVGQEGVDFHWWSRSVFHWNTPANPIDFEQREGRVDRYDSLAVRRNLAADLGDQALAREEPNVWETLYRLTQEAPSDLGSFSPHWVYPGETSIERHVAPYPLSVDGKRYEDLKRDVALYRLTFGQPRQEDMLALMKANLADTDGGEYEALRIDLSAPPHRSTGSADSSVADGTVE